MDSIEDRAATRQMPLPAARDLKTCQGLCGRICEVSVAGDYFDVDGKQPDGFKPDCKQCRAKQRMLKQAANRDKQLDHIDKRIVKLLSESQPGGSRVPHIAEILENIVHLMGGTKGLSQSVVQTYVQAEPGSAVRQRMLGQILTLANQVTDTGAAKVPLELLSEDEIDQEIARRNNNIVNGTIVPDEDDDSDLEDSTLDDTDALDDEEDD